jgi:hypothetical protein
VRKNQLDYLPVAVRHALHEAEERQSQKQRLHELLIKPTGDETPLLPICSYCKKIRDKQNFWKYLNLRFTHGICPDCLPKFLPKSHRPHDLY